MLKNRDVDGTYWCDDHQYTISEAEDPNAVALAIVRRELTADALAALAHLLNNAVCPVACEASLMGHQYPELQQAVADLRKTIKQILG
jgi:intracellular sulfur oxidation DsrE/DsrF family protein